MILVRLVIGLWHFDAVLREHLADGLLSIADPGIAASCLPFAPDLMASFSASCQARATRTSRSRARSQSVAQVAQAAALLRSYLQ